MVRIQKPQDRNDPAAFYFPALAQIVIVDLGTIANVATAMTVIVGVVFGLIEMRRSRREREERAAFAAVQAFMTPEWMSSSMIVHSFPKGAYACRHAKKLGVVPMAGGTTRTPQCDQDEFGDGCTNRLPRLAAVICVSSANRRTSLNGV